MLLLLKDFSSDYWTILQPDQTAFVIDDIPYPYRDVVERVRPIAGCKNIAFSVLAFLLHAALRLIQVF